MFSLTLGYLLEEQDKEETETPSQNRLIER